MTIISGNFVKINGTKVTIEVNSLGHAKLALKELKLKKKEFQAQKKILTSKMQEIRAAYTEMVRTRGSVIRGGGGFGKFIRAFQSISRDSKRSDLASELAPYETERQQTEAMINTLESIILKVELAILEQNHLT